MSVLSDLMFLLSVYVVIQAHEKCAFELDTVYRFKMTIAFFIVHFIVIKLSVRFKNSLQLDNINKQILRHCFCGLIIYFLIK